MRAPGTLATRADPIEFREHRDGERVLRVSAAFEQAALSLGLLEPGGLERVLASAAGPRGRARTAVVSLPGHGVRLLLRPVHGGGLLRGVLRDRLLGLARPLGELRAHAELYAAGAPVPVPVLVAARRAAGAYRAVIGSLYEEGALDGALFLASARDARTRRRAAAAAGGAVRALHDLGARHPDLHVGNLLIREREHAIDALVVDLDRARLLPALGARERMAGLMRLHRSLVKRGLLAGVGARGCAGFFAAYTAGDRELRRALLRHLPRERARLALHTLGYRLARRRGARASASPEARSAAPRPSRATPPLPPPRAR